MPTSEGAIHSGQQSDSMHAFHHPQQNMNQMQHAQFQNPTMFQMQHAQAFPPCSFQNQSSNFHSVDVSSEQSPMGGDYPMDLGMQPQSHEMMFNPQAFHTAAAPSYPQHPLMEK